MLRSIELEAPWLGFVLGGKAEPSLDQRIEPYLFLSSKAQTLGRMLLLYSCVISVLCLRLAFDCRETVSTSVLERVRLFS